MAGLFSWHLPRFYRAALRPIPDPPGMVAATVPVRVNPPSLWRDYRWLRRLFRKIN